MKNKYLCLVIIEIYLWKKWLRCNNSRTTPISWSEIKLVHKRKSNIHMKTQISMRLKELMSIFTISNYCEPRPINYFKPNI